jgi:hypothetical protein
MVNVPALEQSTGPFGTALATDGATTKNDAARKIAMEIERSLRRVGYIA